jgi:hypothetical protein
VDYGVYFLAFCFYTVRPLPISTTLFFPGMGLTSHHSWIKGVGEKAAGKLTVEMVLGNHVTCITQYASDLTEKIKKVLNGVER